MKKHLSEIIFLVLFAVLLGAVIYVFKYQQAQHPSAIPPKYALTSQSPIVSVDEKGQIFVRTDCTIEEYRNTIGQLVNEILTLRKAQPPKADKPEVK